jgi:signal transduction histidine kinase
VATSQLIRHRLISIVLLGVVTSALSLFALERALSTSMAVRRQRAHDIVTAEVERLAAVAPSAALLQEPSVTTYLGVRGGWATSPAEATRAPGLPPAWRETLGEAVTRCLSQHTRVELDLDLAPNRLVVAAAPARAGGCAWVAYLVVPLASLQTWRIVTVALAIATALLVATAVWATLLFRRSAAALNATLNALGKDLTTPVPTPRAAELGGIADGIRGLAADLLASREATERLGRELAQKDRLAALGRVAAGVAHEVRNPLASIKLRLDLTAAAGDLPEATRKAVVGASEEIARLDRLVSDLLLVAGNKIGPRRAVDLGALAQARVEALQPWATATRQVTLRPSGDGVADADPEAVARALDNLLRNAVEASPAGDVVEVRVGDVRGAVPRAIVVQVEDHGGGVEPARAAELFEPFFTTKAEGTGLGLAISRAIARAHGGDVTYARAGAVTRFSLSLPRAQRAEAA